MKVPRIPPRPDLKWVRPSHRIRLLPSTIPGRPLGITVYGHSGWGDVDRHVICPRTWPERQLVCPICALVVEPVIYNPRYPYWVCTYANGIDRSNEHAGVQIFDLPNWCTEEVVAFQERHPQTDVTNPHTGSDILLTEEIPLARFDDVTCRAEVTPPNPLHNDARVIKQWMDERHDLEHIFGYTPTHHLELMSLAELIGRVIDERTREYDAWRDTVDPPPGTAETQTS